MQPAAELTQLAALEERLAGLERTVATRPGGGSD
jgi:hypothetical protein